MVVRLNVPIREELRKRFRIACLEDGRSMAEVVTELIEKRLEKRGRETARQ